ncbi:DUF6515 family protein [Ancylomarina sp. DW003]|nr:DUF6515 family protein [Ancylomarina sp. DW003]MDE5422816.1 DUF6515 family protein [Ancylomarina sp. DW003]
MTKFFKLLTVLILLSCSLSIQAQKAKRHNKKQTKVAVISTKRQHYKTLPKWGVKVTHKPSNASLIKYRGVTYHLKNGIYYTYMAGKYNMSKAPVGLRVKLIPAMHTRIMHNGHTYYYYYGTYYTYIPNANNYEVITPPLGAMVDVLPNGYNKIVIEGITYWSDGKTYYKAVGIENGDVIYEVVGNTQL